MRLSFHIALVENHKDWKTLLTKHGKTRWPNKAWEFEIFRSGGLGNLLGLSLAWTRKTDHAGIRLEATFIGFEMRYQFYDSRHWDDETDNYVVYDEAYFKRHSGK